MVVAIGTRPQDRNNTDGARLCLVVVVVEAPAAPFSFGNNLKQASSSSSFSGILLVEHVAVLGAVFRPTSSIIIVCQNQSGIVMTGGRPLLADY